MQNSRSWFIDFLAEMVEKYADVENQRCELGGVNDELDKSGDGYENGGVML